MATIHRYNVHHRPNLITLIILWFTVSVTIVQLFDENGFCNQWLPLSLPELWGYGEAWRLLTVTLVHGDPMHILMNGYSLWIIGSIVEGAFGRRGLVLLYVASGLGGSIAVALFGEVFTPVVGASGAIFGLFGALIAYMYSRVGSVRGMWNVPYARQVMVVLAINIFISFMPEISALGHFGGLAVGLLMGYLLERKASRRLALGEKVGGVILALALAGLTVYAVMPVNRGGYWLVQSERVLQDALGDKVVLEVDKDSNDVWGWHIIDKAKTLEGVRKAKDYFDRIGPDFDHSSIYVAEKDRHGRELQRIDEELRHPRAPDAPPSHVSP